MSDAQAWPKSKCRILLSRSINIYIYMYIYTYYIICMYINNSFTGKGLEVAKVYKKWLFVRQRVQLQISQIHLVATNILGLLHLSLGRSRLVGMESRLPDDLFQAVCAGRSHSCWSSWRITPVNSPFKNIDTRWNGHMSARTYICVDATEFEQHIEIEVRYSTV